MKKELKVWAITCIAFWMLAPKISVGQQDSIESRQLNDVVISAGKFPRDRSQTGKVVDIITRDEIVKNAGRDLSQLLQERTGLFVNGANSNPGKDKGIYLRGASPQYVLLMIDGVPVTDPSGVNGVFDLRLLSLNNIERIEILKGSQSTLYGSDAMAGVINIITREPVKGFEAAAGLSAGSYGQFNADITTAGRKGNLGYSAGYNFRRSGGISEALDPSEDDDFDKDSFSQHSLNVKMEIRPTERFRITPFIQYSDIEGDYDAGAFTDSEINNYTAQNLRYGITAGGEDEVNSWRAVLIRNRTDRRFISDFGDFEATGEMDHGEIYFLHKLSATWQFMGGIMFQHQEISSEEIEDMSIFAPYLSVFFRPADGVNIEGGVRYNRHNAFGNETTFSFNPSWQIDRRWKLFFNYSTGFKAPTLNQLFGQFGANPGLRPEYSRSVEGGLYHTRENMNFRLTAFNRKIDDIIIYTDRYVNSDRQDVTGIEFESEFSITNNFKASFSYTWLRGETELVTGDSTFSGLLRQPEHGFQAGLLFEPSAAWAFSSFLNYFGKRNDIFFNLESFQTEFVELDPYVLLDLRVHRNFSKSGSGVFAEVRNLLNSEYFESYGYAVMGRTFHVGVLWSPDFR